MTKDTNIKILRPSAALAVPTTEYATGYETARGPASTATSTSANHLVDTAGNFVNLGIKVGDIIKDITTGKYALVTVVGSATNLTVGADIFTSGDSYQIFTNTGFVPNSYGGPYHEAVAWLDVTAAATDVGDTLDVYLDTSFDGGVTWLNIGHFTQVLGNGGAKRYVMSFKANPIASSNSVDMTANQAAGAALQCGLGNNFRVRSTLVDAGTQNASFTYSVSMVLKK